MTKSTKHTDGISRTAPEGELEDERVRRPICNMALLVLHLVLSGFMFEEKILECYSEHYPNGAPSHLILPFLYFLADEFGTLKIFFQRVLLFSKGHL